MTMLSYSQNTPRIKAFKGRTLSHAVPLEVLSKAGRQVQMDRNMSDTYVARRFLPFGALGTDANTINRFFGGITGGDKVASVVAQHVIQEGVTPTPDSITPYDVTTVLEQYGCLYGYTDKVANLYEDNIPEEMATLVGERMTFVNEMIVYGALRSATNQFFGGTGTTRATVNGAITLPLLRRIAKNLQANHGRPVNKMLKASQNYDTSAVSEGYMVYCSTDLEPDIRDLLGFTPIEKYATGTPMANEIGKCERFRFITSPDFPALLDAGATVASAPSLQSQSGTNIDVYQFIVTAQDAWSQIALRGLGSMFIADLPTSVSSKTDPFGQRGYAGAMWWKAVMVENPGWMAVGNVGVKTLVG